MYSSGFLSVLGVRDKNLMPEIRAWASILLISTHMHNYLQLASPSEVSYSKSRYATKKKELKINK